MRKETIAAIAFCAVLLAGCIGVPSTVSTSQACGITTSWGTGSWIGFALLACLLSIFILTLVYMASEFFQLSAGVAWAKNEFYQSLMNVFIVANLALFVGILCYAGLPQAFGFPAGVNIFDYAFSYVSWLNGVIIEGYLHALILQWRAAVATSFAFGASPGGIGINVQPLVGLSSFESAMNLILQAMTLAWITNLVQAEVLKFIMVSMFNVVLPIGLVLRSFSFTRNFGGALMGLAIGLFVFYPILLGMNALAIKDATDKISQSLSDQTTCTIGSTDECCSPLPCQPESAGSTTGACTKCIFEGEATDPANPGAPPNPLECCSARLDPNDNKYCLKLMYEGDACSSPNDCFSKQCGNGVCTGSCKLHPGIFSVGTGETTSMIKTVGRLVATGALSYFGPMMIARSLLVGGPLFLIIGAIDIFWLLIDLASNILIAAILLPAFNFIMLITITRDISKFLGEEIDVSNLTRMI